MNLENQSSKQDSLNTVSSEFRLVKSHSQSGTCRPRGSHPRFVQCTTSCIGCLRELRTDRRPNPRPTSLANLHQEPVFQNPLSKICRRLMLPSRFDLRLANFRRRTT